MLIYTGEDFEKGLNFDRYRTRIEESGCNSCIWVDTFSTLTASKNNIEAILLELLEHILLVWVKVERDDSFLKGDHLHILCGEVFWTSHTLSILSDLILTKALFDTIPLDGIVSIIPNTAGLSSSCFHRSVFMNFKLKMNPVRACGGACVRGSHINGFRILVEELLEFCS